MGDVRSVQMCCCLDWLKRVLVLVAIGMQSSWAEGVEVPVAADKGESGAEAPAQARDVGSNPAEDDAVLRRRAEDRWRALIDGDLRAAYEFQLPSYRAVTPFEKFRSRFGRAVAWHMATAEEVSYDGPEVARVRVAVDASILPASTGDAIRSVTRVREVWLKRDGQWWYSATE